MEGFGNTENSKERQPWTTDMMRENRDKWNLAGDVGVLEYLQNFGDKLLSETENTLNLLDSFEADLNTSCLQVSNITNKFLSLADSQFVENRVYDDEETPTPETAGEVPSGPAKTKQEVESDIFSRLKESVNNGLNVLSTKFEAVEVANSDSEDDDSGPTGVVYKPINQFNYRPLPHLIGSVDFIKDSTLGLEELPSEDEESIEEESSFDSKELTEENEDSEPESDRTNVILPKERADLFSMMQNQIENDEFADLLFKQANAKTMENAENESRIQKQQSRSLFSTTPPPLDDSYDDDFGSNDDLIFGSNNQNDFNDSEDLFAPKTKTSLWDNENKNDFVSNDVESTNSNDNHKKVMQDLEKRFSNNFKSRIDDYDDISPSPPPLNDDMNNDHTQENYSKFKRKESSLFDNNREENDEVDDLFGSTSETVSAVSTKKKIYPGSVNVFGNNANIFKDSVKQQIDNSMSKSGKNEESSKTDNDIISKTISSIRKNYDDNEDDEDDEDSMFKSSNHLEKSSSRSSSVKMSESFQDDNISIKSNKSAGLFDDVLTNTKKSAIKKTMDDLFSDLNNCGDENDGDDLFGTNFPSKGASKSNDLFGSSKNSANLFSAESSSSTVTKSNKTNVVDLFSDVDAEDDLFSNFISQKQSDSKNDKSNDFMGNKNLDNKISSKPISLFEDDDDDTNIFGSDFVTKSSSSGLSSNVFADNKKISAKVDGDKSEPLSSAVLPSDPVTSSSKVVKGGGLFGEEDDDSYLFGENRTTPGDDLFSSNLFSKNQSVVVETNEKSVFKAAISEKVVNDNDLFSNVGVSDGMSTSLKSGKQIIDERSNKARDVNDLFGKESENVVEDTQSTVPSKTIKTASVKSLSLFSDNVNDDFDDDLFNTNKVPTKIVHNENDDDKAKSDKKSTTSALPDKLNNTFSDLSNSEVLPNDTKSESKNLSSKLNSSSDSLFNKDDSSDKNDLSDHWSVVPPLPDPTVDDSPLFSDKNSYVSYGEKNVNDELFKNQLESSIGNTERERSKTTSENDVDYVKKTESDDLLFNKTATLVPSLPVNKVSTGNDFSSSDSDLFSSDKTSAFPQTDKKDTQDKNSSGSHRNISDSSSFGKKIFDADHSLPKIPTDSIKKPQVPTKPLKPEPPKSLNIRAPLTTPDLFGNNSNKDSSSKSSLDVHDGSTFSSQSSSAVPSPRITPGKLNLEKSLNINPKALLPDARPPSFKKSSSPPVAKANLITETQKEIIDNESARKNDNKLSFDSKDDKIISGSSSSLPNTDSEPVLHSIAKDRAKIQVKRRPQTRKARREAIRQSTIENSNYEDDETDNSSSITTQSNKEPKSTSSSIFDQPSNILSPSTDEEDLFGIPPLDLPPDYSKVSVSPGDVFDAPIIISSDSTGSNSNNPESKDVPNENIASNDGPKKINDRLDIFESNSNSEHSIIINNPMKSKENSGDIFSDVVCNENKNKISPDIDNLTGGKTVGSNLFSDIDDSDLFFEKSKKIPKNSTDLSNDSDIFSTKSDKSKIIEDDSPDLFLSASTKAVSNDTSKPDLLFSESEKTKEKQNEVRTNDPNSLPHKSEKPEENAVFNDDLQKGDASNIICGVFNTGVVNICDKLSITPPTDDELFPPSDWTTSSKKENTIISVPEKIKTDSLFVTNTVNSNEHDDDCNLFSASKTTSSLIKDNSIVHKKSDNSGVKSKARLVDDLFSDDVGEDDLFGAVKSKTESTFQSKSVGGLKKSKDTLVSNKVETSSVIKTGSLFGDDDDDENDIFGSSNKNKSLNTRSASISTDFSNQLGDSSRRNIKKSSGVTKQTKLLSSAKPDEDFVDPLAALGKKD